MKMYQAIASTAGAYHRCVASDNTVWRERHSDYLTKLESFLPSGSGVDRGTKIIVDETNDDRITLDLAFHHMNERGFYSGWTEHRAIVTPTFSGFSVKITGRDRDGIKEYLSDLIHHSLSGDAPVARVLPDAAAPAPAAWIDDAARSHRSEVIDWLVSRGWDRDAQPSTAPIPV